MLRSLRIGLVSLVIAATSAWPACAPFSDGPDGADASTAEPGTDATTTADGGDAELPAECWALQFDGDQDFVEVADDVALDPTGPSTVEAWVRYEQDTRSEYQVVSHHDHGAKQGYLLMIYGQGSNQKDGGPAELGASGRYYDGEGTWQAGFGTASRVDKGEWAHIAVAYDGAGELRTYVNGVLKSTVKPTKAPANADYAGPLRIGASSQGAGTFFFVGVIDEVRLSKVARYGTTPFTPSRRWSPDADTIALYHFDEGEGDVANDSNGKHDGRIYGATWQRARCQ